MGCNSVQQRLEKVSLESGRGIEVCPMMRQLRNPKIDNTAHHTVQDVKVAPTKLHSNDLLKIIRPGSYVSDPALCHES